MINFLQKNNKADMASMTVTKVSYPQAHDVRSSAHASGLIGR